MTIQGHPADLAPERWRPVLGYEDLYEVSDLGRVRSLPRICRNGTRRRGVLLNPGTNSNGYRRVGLHRDGHFKTRCVHRLVTEAFIGPRPDGLQTRHLNGNKDDNRLANLIYGTQSENQLDNVRHGVHHLSSKATCINGHPLGGENLAIYAGKRKCRECNKVRNRQWRLSRQGGAA